MKPKPDDDTRRFLRIETGKITRRPASMRNVGVTINRVRKPSMPKLPWSDHEDDDETKSCRSAGFDPRR
jgi:hypothetical protein